MKITRLPRIVGRFLRLGWIIVSGMLSLAWFLKRSAGNPVNARIAWMQWMSRRLLSLLHCQVTVSGAIPKRGLIACNHLGYIDILVIGSVCPTIFIAKSDVKEWPVFGWLASRAGSIFVSRGAPYKVEKQLRQMEHHLRDGYLVVLFPEGTSSDGRTVLPFRSSLFESVFSTECPVTPAAIGYDLGDKGNVGLEIAYWGDLILIPHLLNLLSKKSFTARLSFGLMRSPMSDRKREAKLLYQEVLGIHGDLAKKQ